MSVSVSVSVCVCTHVRVFSERKVFEFQPGTLAERLTSNQKALHGLESQAGTQNISFTNN